LSIRNFNDVRQTKSHAAVHFVPFEVEIAIDCKVEKSSDIHLIPAELIYS
jgi:hypothetical protein